LPATDRDMLSSAMNEPNPDATVRVRTVAVIMRAADQAEIKPV